MPIHIRDAVPGDRAIIAEFNSRLASETEGQALDPAIIGPGVARLLADPALGRYWVADVDGEIVGQVMVTYEWSDWRNGLLWWLQSVYVHPDHRRSGVFSALFGHVEQMARDAPDVVGIRLYLEKHNRRARATYENFGMTMTDYQVMQVEFGDPLHSGTG